MNTTRRGPDGTWHCLCGCTFSDVAAAERHDQDACVSNDGAGAVFYALASLAVVIAVAAWLIFG